MKRNIKLETVAILSIAVALLATGAFCKAGAASKAAPPKAEAPKAEAPKADATRTNEPKVKIKIACVGDGMTSSRYPETLGLILRGDYEVKNLGVPNATVMKSGNVSYWNQKKIEEAEAFGPQMVVIQLGTCDAKSNNWKNADAFLADYKALITAFKNLTSKPKVFAVIPPPVFGTNALGIDGALVRGEITLAITAAARDAKVDTIDLYTPFTKSQDQFPDGVNPSGDGGNVIAWRLFHYLTGAPSFDPPDDIFVNNMMVKIVRYNKDPVYYTIDDKWPSTNSPVYKMPIRLTASTRLKAISAGKNGKTPEVEGMYSLVTPFAPSKPSKTAPGLEYRYYEEKDPAALLDMSKLSPVSSGETNDLLMTGIDQKKICWGFRWTGYLIVPRDGIYKFYLTSDDGSLLRISNTPVVDNNEMHPRRERSGKLALKAGTHSIEMSFFNGASEGWFFNIEWEGPGMQRQTIPASAFVHEPLM